MGLAAAATRGGHRREPPKRPGAKFYKWEMKGVPIRIEIGPRDIENGVAVLARRDGKKLTVPLDGLLASIEEEAADLQEAMLARAQAFLASKVKDCETAEEARVQTAAGVARVAWCGSEECGHRIEEEVGAAVLGEPWRSSEKGERSCIVCGARTEKCALLARQY